LIHIIAQDFADRAQPIVHRMTAIITILMLALVLLIYGAEFLAAIGTFAIGVQMLFYVLAAGCSYILAYRLPDAQRSVIALGVCTRNIGAALAPVVAVPNLDRRVIVMVTLAAPLTLGCAALMAWIFARFAMNRERLGKPLAGKSR